MRENTCKAIIRKTTFTIFISLFLVAPRHEVIWCENLRGTDLAFNKSLNLFVITDISMYVRPV